MRRTPVAAAVLAAAIAPVLCLGFLTGCASPGGANNSEVQHQIARKQWASARANVMGSLAKEQYENGNFEKCRQTIDEALKMDPDNAPLRLLSARLAIEQGSLEVADRELVQARRLDPRSAEADYLSGVVCQRWQRNQEAYDYYRSASEKQTTELAYLMAQAEMLVALARPDDALALLQTRVVYFEYSATIRDAVGQLLMQKGKYPEAAEVLRQASILANDDNTVREHLALALMHNNEYRDANDVLVRLLKDDKYAKRADLYLALAECQMRTNHAREARDTFDTASQLSPNLPAVWLGMARAALQVHDFRRAEIALKHALSIEPASSEGNLLLGYVRMRQDKFDDALAAFRKANALDAGDTVSLCMVGYVLEKMGKSADALRCYADALKIRPGDEMATRLMAEVQLHE
jgi:tetratricopeptide (TPR) repeat protein